MKTMESHFKGKSAIQHVLDARIKGKAVSDETHGVELPGHLSAACDAAKETAALLLILSILFPQPIPLAIFAAAYLVWKMGRSALLGWIRLQRLHRLIEEERWEIEHHRPQERIELLALYRAKGFSGKLLEEVVDVLMGDENRLLQVMLEEELGLTLGTFEHPLKQGFGAGVGVLLATAILVLGYFLHPVYGLYTGVLIAIALPAGWAAKKEKNKVFPSIVWNLALASLAAIIAYEISLSI